MNLKPAVIYARAQETHDRHCAIPCRVQFVALHTGTWNEWRRGAITDNGLIGISRSDPWADETGQLLVSVALFKTVRP